MTQTTKQAKPSSRKRRGNVNPDGNGYRAQVRLKGPDGRVIRTTKRVKSVAEGKAWVSATETAILAGTHPKQLANGTAPIVRTVGDPLRGPGETGEQTEARQGTEALYMYAEEHLGDAKGWRRLYREVYLPFWSEHLGPDTPLTEVTADMIAAGLAKLRRRKGRSGEPLKEPTLRGWYTPLAAAFKRATDRGWIDRDPCKGVTRPAKSEGRQRFLTEDEASRLLTEARKGPDDVLYNILLFILGAGLRKGEAMGLSVKDVMIQGDTGAILVRKAKGRKLRTVPLVGPVLDLARKLTEDQDGDAPLFGRRRFPEERWYAARERAGLAGGNGEEPVVVHTGRHTFATMALFNGADTRAVQEMCGHSRIDETERYTHIVQAHLQRAAEGLTGFLSAAAAE